MTIDVQPQPVFLPFACIQSMRYLILVKIYMKICINLFSSQTYFWNYLDSDTYFLVVEFERLENIEMQRKKENLCLIDALSHVKEGHRRILSIKNEILFLDYIHIFYFFLCTQCIGTNERFINSANKLYVVFFSSSKISNSWILLSGLRAKPQSVFAFSIYHWGLKFLYLSLFISKRILP